MMHATTHNRPHLSHSQRIPNASRHGRVNLHRKTSRRAAQRAQSFYMDANASAPISVAVKAAMIDAMGELHGNPSSLHAVGNSSRDALDNARRTVAAYMGAEPGSDIVFTSGATEANTSALIGLALGSRAAGRGNRILVSAVEHPSILKSAEFASQQLGFQVESIPVDRYGRVLPEALADLLGDGAAVVAIMAANNETGCVNDLAALAEVCAEANSPFLVDMVQLAGKAPVDVNHPGITAAVISGHKFGGPKGAAALYLQAGAAYTPLFAGSQERGKRAGTENVAAIVGLAVAATEAAARVRANDRLRAANDAMRAAFAAEGDVLFNSPDDGLANTLSVSFLGVDGNRLVTKLNRRGIYVSSGSACSSGSSRPSHVLQALGISDEAMAGTVRISLDPTFPFEHLDTAIETIVSTVRKLRQRKTRA